LEQLKAEPGDEKLRWCKSNWYNMWQERTKGWQK